MTIIERLKAVQCSDTVEVCREAAAEIERLRDMLRWRDAKVELPPTLEPVLVAGRIGDWMAVHEGFWAGRYWSSIRYNVDEAESLEEARREKITSVSFWRPMPELPEATP